MFRNISTLFIAALTMFASAAEAGSICRDGTYSYSEGRGTCSWHGGVALSGVVLPPPPSWSHTFETSNGFFPSVYYRANYSTSTSGFDYDCNVSLVYPADDHISESIALSFKMNVPDNLSTVEVSERNITVFAVNQGSYYRIAGNWAWVSKDNWVTIWKVTLSPTLRNPSYTLTPEDLKSIFNADSFVISIRTRPDVTIRVPNISNNISVTWSKCNSY